MTYGACTQDFAQFARAARSKSSIQPAILCGVALGLSASVGLALLYASPEEPTGEVPPAIQLTDAAVAPPPAAIAPLRYYASLLDPAFSGGAKPVTFAQSAPLRTGFAPLKPHMATTRDMIPLADLRPTDTKVAALETDEIKTDIDTTDGGPAERSITQTAPLASEIMRDVPLPAPRPRFDSADDVGAPLASARRQLARQAVEPPAPATAATTATGPTFFDRLFGSSTNKTPPAQTALAYAAPQDSLIGNIFSASRPPASPDAYTAVYDISAHTVHMPDGTKLEAHSGLGDAFDNPNSVTQRMRGATPPNVYDLTPREAMFHGVRALRLTPTGGTTYGRGGLLAHTYMLRGRSGESNGCVVFKDYDAFLRAYDNGKIRRLAVVARI